MWGLVVEWWPVLAALWVGTVFGFVLCGVMASGRIEDAFEEAEARADHKQFLREQAVRDEAELSEDYDLETQQ